MLYHDREIGQPYSSTVHIPESIDIEVTGRCEFDCPKCWGSKPDCNRDLTAKQWLRVFKKLDNYSDVSFVERVVITGGEPLLRKDLPEIIEGLSDNGDRYITLSTTGIDRHNMLKQVLGRLGTIGIPIDGPSPEVNSLWRYHSSLADGGLSTSLEALKLTQNFNSNPDLETVIRTLVHHGNVNYVSEIPKFLEKSGIDISKLVWNLYELNSRGLVKDSFVTDIITSTESIASFKSGPEQFQQEIHKAGSKFKQVVIKKMGNAAGRNFIINPSGECRSVTFSKFKNALIEKVYGNIHSDSKNTLDLLNDDHDTITALSSDAALYLDGYCPDDLYDLD